MTDKVIWSNQYRLLGRLKSLWGFCGDQYSIVMHRSTFVVGGGN